jgi:ankyrin repeat protein
MVPSYPDRTALHIAVLADDKEMVQVGQSIKQQAVFV